MDRWKAEQGREKRKIRREKIRRERVRRKKMQMREKVGKSRNTVFFQWFVAPEGRKVGSLKRRVMKVCTPLWREAHFEVKMYKTHHSRTTFGSRDVEKVHAVVARSTFWSQNVQNTPCSDHFWKLRCRKSARRCGAKHILKSKCTKHTMLGPLLEVEILKKCTPMWRESTFWSQNVQNTPCSDHFWKLRCRKSARRCGAKHILKSKCTKHTMLGPLLEVEILKKCTPLWRESTFWSQNVQNTHCSDHFWKLRCRKSARRCGAKHISKSKCTKHHMFAPLLEVRMSFRVAGARDCGPCQKWASREGFCGIFNYNHHYTTLHSNTLHYTTTTTTPWLHSTTLHSTTLHCTQLHSNTLTYTTLHYTTLHSTTLHYITRHYTTLHYTTFHYTTLHYTALHYNYNYTKLHYTTLHYTTLHSTTLHYTTLHYTEWHCTTDRQVDR